MFQIYPIYRLFIDSNLLLHSAHELFQFPLFPQDPCPHFLRRCRNFRPFLSPQEGYCIHRTFSKTETTTDTSLHIDRSNVIPHFNSTHRTSLIGANAAFGAFIFVHLCLKTAGCKRVGKVELRPPPQNRAATPAAVTYKTCLVCAVIACVNQSCLLGPVQDIVRLLPADLAGKLTLYQKPRRRIKNEAYIPRRITGSHTNPAGTLGNRYIICLIYKSGNLFIGMNLTFRVNGMLNWNNTCQWCRVSGKGGPHGLMVIILPEFPQPFVFRCASPRMKGNSKRPGIVGIRP